MQQANERLCGMVETVTFQNEENGFAVLTLCDDEGELICAVGPLAGSTPGEEVTLAGRWTEHSVYGRQFEAAACVHKMPESEGAILKYLSSGVLPGIGPATARRIVDRFHEQALEVLATNPEKYASIKGFSREKAMVAGRRFEEVFAAREAVATLARLGLSASEALPVYRHFGKYTLDIVEANPYLLCGWPLYMSFERADRLAQRTSLGPESPERTRAALQYALRHNLNNGHTCLPEEKLLQTVIEFFRIPPQDAARQLEAMLESGDLFRAVADDMAFLYLPEYYKAEMSAALRLRALASGPVLEPAHFEKQMSLLEAAQDIHYAPAQREAIQEALSRRVLVITGGPGTGKTTTVNAIIALYEQQADRVFLAAPTGRAAKRMSELTGREAVTIHRLLEVEFRGGSDEIPHFKRNEENPLRCDVLIVDEVSMVDALLFECVLAALRPGCRLVLVGDADQLPSVGAGNVLKGITDAGVVPVVALKKVFRQAAASLIVRNAHRIVEGETPQKGGKDDDYFFLTAYGAACQKLVCELVAQRLPTGYGLSPVQDIQVLCPGRKGQLGTEMLGRRLQEVLNPPAADKPEIRREGICFRLGDKVMQIKNNYDIPFTRTSGEVGAGAFNGDIGVVEEINPARGTLTVLCEDRRVSYTAEELHELELAYAVTIHKSQGSEFEAVVLVVEEVPERLRYRNLLYTGVTRAKKVCVLAGRQQIVEQMVRNGYRNRRYSCFAHFLVDEDLL